jgi:hypothetical protein
MIGSKQRSQVALRLSVGLVLWVSSHAYLVMLAKQAC